MMKRKLPTSWNDVTLRHLIEIENIRNDKSIDGEPYAEITRSLLMLSLFMFSLEESSFLQRKSPMYASSTILIRMYGK